MLAGDYCCYQKAEEAPQASLEVSLANLDLVGAVTISERMPESLQVRAVLCSTACVPLGRVEGAHLP